MCKHTVTLLLPNIVTLFDLYMGLYADRDETVVKNAVILAMLLGYSLSHIACKMQLFWQLMHIYIAIANQGNIEFNENPRQMYLIMLKI